MSDGTPPTAFQGEPECSGLPGAMRLLSAPEAETDPDDPVDISRRAKPRQTLVVCFSARGKAETVADDASQHTEG